MANELELSNALLAAKAHLDHKYAEVNAAKDAWKANPTEWLTGKQAEAIAVCYDALVAFWTIQRQLCEIRGASFSDVDADTLHKADKMARTIRVAISMQN